MTGEATGSPDAAASPVRAVLASFDQGTTSVAGIAQDTGLSVDLVRAVLDQLIRMGKLQVTKLTAGCPVDAASCGGCVSAAPDGSGCGLGPAESGSPMIIELVPGSLQRASSPEDH